MFKTVMTVITAAIAATSISSAASADCYGCGWNGYIKWDNEVRQQVGGKLYTLAMGSDAFHTSVVKLRQVSQQMDKEIYADQIAAGFNDQHARHVAYHEARQRIHTITERLLAKASQFDMSNTYKWKGTVDYEADKELNHIKGGGYRLSEPSIVHLNN